MRSNASGVRTSVSAARAAAIVSAFPKRVPPVETSSTATPITTRCSSGGAITAATSSLIP